MVLNLATEGGRVCPQPSEWNDFFNVLGGKRDQAGRWQPSPPLILAAWWDTPEWMKRERLREQLQWAETNGRLQAAYEFLAGLSEGDWYHEGE